MALEGRRLRHQLLEKTLLMSLGAVNGTECHCLLLLLLLGGVELLLLLLGIPRLLSLASVMLRALWTVEM